MQRHETEPDAYSLMKTLVGLTDASTSFGAFLYETGGCGC